MPASIYDTIAAVVDPLGDPKLSLSAIDRCTERRVLSHPTVVRQWVLGWAFALSLPAASAELFEVRLRAMLDEPRGYCIDMVGYKERARTDRPLQAHTCYGYQGEVAADQGTERALALQGRLRFPHFGVCMTASGLSRGSPLVLAECSERSDQTFSFRPSGEIAPSAAPTLCVTVADGRGIPGGGGRPVHLRRSLGLEACNDEAETRQRWQLSPTAN